MNTFNILFLGDIFGQPGRDAVQTHLPNLRKRLALHAVVANGENAAGGRGITKEIADELFASGVDVITLGDHTFDQKNTDALLESEKRLLRPANFPAGTAGHGFGIYQIGGLKLGVLNLMGRVFMNATLDCPFQHSLAHMKAHTLGVHYDALIVDAHTEATSEIACLGHVWDGKASLVVGTHTHIPTADGRVLPGGTGFQSDAGMCGVYDSSLGVAYDGPLQKFLKGGHFPFTPARGEATLCGVFVQVAASGPTKGRAVALQPLRLGGSLVPAQV